MTDATKIESLDYETPPKSGKREFLSRWSALLLIGVQVIWVFPGMLLFAWPILDGGPKEPFRDFCCDAALALPVLTAIVVGIMDCRRQFHRGDSVLRAWPSIIAIFLASAAALWVLYGWILDDIVRRKIPWMAL